MDCLPIIATSLPFNKYTARVSSPTSEEFSSVFDASHGELSDEGVTESSQHRQIIFGNKVPESAKNFRFPTREDHVWTQPLKAEGFEGLAHSKRFIAQDGACQFRALAYIFYNDQSKHPQVRQDIVNWLEKNPQEFLEAHDENILPLEIALERMRDTGEWGNEHTLRAASEVFQAEIVVVSSTQLDGRHRGFGETYGFNKRFRKQQIGLFFSNEHYELLFKDPSSLKAPCMSPPGTLALATLKGVPISIITYNGRSDKLRDSNSF
ncbi:hypothetical protein O181_033076 [Austropuccinia psidii MF-1]|uniref:OTU domain-containing protein n=1 Tax=Austropuccinia psidii MF-1 TaxID=1389203 RepID=A0A9Q3H6R2_9BASI|nr:hypothetical protein [Austropuccinia psidii MF-1]